MALKTFYYSLWMIFIILTLVRGSCLEYGHSCWGAHGKRSDSNKIYHTDMKSPTEADFQDLNAISEKNTYDSIEEQMNGSIDNLKHDSTKDTVDLIEPAEKMTSRFKKFLYKQLNNNGNQHNLEPPEYNFQKSANIPMISARWRRLPIYYFRRLKNTESDNDWLKELQGDSQNNYDGFIV